MLIRVTEGGGVQLDFGDVLPLHDVSFMVPPHYLYSLPDMVSTLMQDFHHKVERPRYAPSRAQS
jgi:hypothetical protein